MQEKQKRFFFLNNRQHTSVFPYTYNIVWFFQAAMTTPAYNPSDCHTLPSIRVLFGCPDVCARQNRLVQHIAPPAKLVFGKRQPRRDRFRYNTDAVAIR